MRKHFRYLKDLFKGDITGLLRYAVKQNRCDKKTTEYFKYSAGGYKFNGDDKAFIRQLKNYAATSM